ncbi:MAG: TonB-dependent receptor [Bradyrhizobium sp.]|nr:TonB-dependent receptor [Bradyrhizobium sp.]
MTKLDRYAISLLALVAGALAASPCRAQTAPANDGRIDDIVVTAQRRAENIQKIPVTVTAITGASLEARGITDVSSFAQVTSGLQLNPGTSGVVLPFLRGVGTSASNLGRESSVAVYADGVYFTRLPVGFFSLNDVERVEVLKGPQGTLFGRNSSAGVIQIITRDPSQAPAMKGSISYGNYDTVEANIYGTTGLGEKVSMNIAGFVRKQRDGYGVNIPTGGRANYTDTAALRGKLLFKPGEGTRVTIAGYYAHTNVGQQGNTYPGTIAGYSSTPYGPLPPIGFYDQRNDIDSAVKSDSWGVSLKVEQDLSFAQLTSISAYTREVEGVDDDGDYTPRADFLFAAHGYVKQFTQELQLAARPGSGLKWIAGLYYYNALTRYDLEKLTTPSGGLAAIYGPGLTGYAVTQTRSIAGYAQASYEILPKLNLTGGLRYTDDHNSADGSLDLNLVPPLTIFAPGPAELITRKLTYKGALDYQFTPTVLGYASVSRGFKSGGFNLVTYNPVPAKPEILDAYEAGIKSDLLGRRLRVNASVFLYNIANPQVQLQSGTSVVTSNAGSARVKGAEIEITAAVTRDLNVRFSATYLDSKYTSYGHLDAAGNVVDGAPSGPQNPASPYGAISPLQAIIANGRQTPQAPKLTFDAGFDYRLKTSIGSIFFTADYYYNDGFFWEPDNFLRQKSFGLLSARIRYSPSDKVSVSLWGKNLTAAHYATQAVTQEGPAGYPYLAGPPRTYGVALDFAF